MEENRAQMVAKLSLFANRLRIAVQRFHDGAFQLCSAEQRAILLTSFLCVHY